MSRSLLVALVLSSAALAEPKVVTLEVGPDVAEKALLRQALRELLSRLELTLAPDGQKPSQVLMHFHVARLASGELWLQGHDAKGTQRFERRLPPGPAQLQVESAAHVLHATCEALLATPAPPPPAPAPKPKVAALAPPPAEATPPVPEVAPAPEPTPAPEPPAPEPPPPSLAPPVVIATPEPAPTAEPTGPPLQLQAGAFLTGRLSGALSGAGVGGELAVRLPVWRRFTVTSHAFGQWGLEAGDALVRVRTQTFSLRVLAGARWLERERFALDASLGGGVDVATTVASSSTLPQSRLRPPRTDAIGELAAQVTARFEVARHLELFVALALEVDLRPRRFVAQLGDEAQVVAAPWPVRPSLLLGASFDALGAVRAVGGP